MIFEFDEAKSAANRTKHGLDFSEAQNLWADVDAIQLPARSDIENRMVLIAQWQDRIWAAIFTLRGQSIRIISVRAARSSEKAIYEQTENDSGKS